MGKDCSSETEETLDTHSNTCLLSTASLKPSNLNRGIVLLAGSTLETFDAGHDVVAGPIVGGIRRI